MNRRLRVGAGSTADQEPRRLDAVRADGAGGGGGTTWSTPRAWLAHMMAACHPAEAREALGGRAPSQGRDGAPAVLEREWKQEVEYPQRSSVSSAAEGRGARVLKHLVQPPRRAIGGARPTAIDRSSAPVIPHLAWTTGSCRKPKKVMPVRAPGEGAARGPANGGGAVLLCGPPNAPAALGQPPIAPSRCPGVTRWRAATPMRLVSTAPRVRTKAWPDLYPDHYPRHQGAVAAAFVQGRIRACPRVRPWELARSSATPAGGGRRALTRLRARLLLRRRRWDCPAWRGAGRYLEGMWMRLGGALGVPRARAGTWPGSRWTRRRPEGAPLHLKGAHRLIAGRAVRGGGGKGVLSSPACHCLEQVPHTVGAVRRIRSAGSRGRHASIEGVCRTREGRRADLTARLVASSCRDTCATHAGHARAGGRCRRAGEWSRCWTKRNRDTPVEPGMVRDQRACGSLRAASGARFTATITLAIVAHGCPWSAPGRGGAR